MSSMKKFTKLSIVCLPAKPVVPPLPAVVAEARPPHHGPAPRHGLPVPALTHLGGGRRTTGMNQPHMTSAVV